MEQKSGVRSVQRAVDILGLLDERHPTVSIREIVEATQLPKTTVLRLLHTLERNHMLSATDDGRYAVGPSLLRWISMAADRWYLPEEGREVMRSLAQKWQETVHVYVRDGVERVCVAQEEGTHSLRQVVQVGDALPLWAGGVAKVLLMDAGPEFLTRVALTSPDGAAHAQVLGSWVEEASEFGYGVSHGEREVGLSAVAAPIRDSEGQVVAALSFGGPTPRFSDDRVRDFAEALQEAAVHLSDLQKFP